MFGLIIKLWNYQIMYYKPAGYLQQISISLTLDCHSDNKPASWLTTTHLKDLERSQNMAVFVFYVMEVKVESFVLKKKHQETLNMHICFSWVNYQQSF